MIQSYMLRPAVQHYITEEYVSTPPALLITDEWGDVWTLGMRFARMTDAPNGEFAFNVLRNGQDMGEFASRIERRRGKIRIFTCQGFKTWSGQSFL